MPVTQQMIAKWRTEKDIEEQGTVAVAAKDVVPGDVIILADESRLEVQRVTTDGFVVRIYAQYESKQTGELIKPELCLVRWTNQLIIVEY